MVFRNLGLLGQRVSAMVTKPLVKEFLKSWRILFLLLTQCEYDIALACFCFMFTINVNNK